MWKDLREHKPNVWQQSILQTTGPVRLVGMRKHQGRPLHIQWSPTPHKEKMNWKNYFWFLTKHFCPLTVKFPLLILRTAFSKKLVLFPDYLHYLHKDKNESQVRYHQFLPIYPIWNQHTPSHGHTFISLAPSSTSLNSNHHESSAWGFYRGFWTSNWTAISQGPRMAAPQTRGQL